MRHCGCTAMDYLDSCYAEYVSQRQEELDELAEIAEAEIAEAAEVAEYERLMEEIGRTYIEDLNQALLDEAEQEWQEELRYRATNT